MKKKKKRRKLSGPQIHDCLISNSIKSLILSVYLKKKKNG